jgi:sulfite reductase (NADPH) hemoprotein beta-component
MYQYDQYDQTLVDERVAQFRDQTRRFLAGQLTEDQFRPLRLMNGLYIQRHAPMLRVAIPYGLLSSRQLHKLAHIARVYDKGYAHFTTRQNIQYNWPKLEQVPDILAELAGVEMHAIQTSGSCIRSVTSDHLAGIAPDEIEDPRPYGEIIRQWSTLHPEFAFLPRKFKIAISGAERDRAATQLHDIGVRLVKNEAGEVGFEILVGGGLGRTPIIGQVIRPFLEKPHLLSYLEAIVRVYNRYGRRDNKYKARIKILVKEEGMDSFRSQVEAEWLRIRDGLLLEQKEIERVQAFFAAAPLSTSDADADANLAEQAQADAAFSRWLRHNTVAHKAAGYRAVFVSLKAPDVPPGDVTDRQLDAIADLADSYSFGQVRVAHTQNLVLADVQEVELYSLWQQLAALGLATPNVGMATDMICCPGLDFCSLANAASLSVAQDINNRFDNLDYLYDIGEVRINISGCMNGCAHQSVGHIGILGVDKHGEEWYQLTLGGSSSNEAAIGERLGPSVPKSEVADVVMAILKVYVEQRQDEESFLQAVQRLGIEPFKEQVYADR